MASSRDPVTGRFVTTSNTPESGEGKFETYADDLPVEIQGADPADLAYGTVPRHAPAGDTLAGTASSFGSSPLRARRPELVHPDDAGSSPPRGPSCVRLRAVPGRTRATPCGLPHRLHRRGADSVDDVQQARVLDPDQEFEQARLFSVDRRHNALIFSPRSAPPPPGVSVTVTDEPSQWQNAIEAGRGAAPGGHIPERICRVRPAMASGPLPPAARVATAGADRGHHGRSGTGDM